MRPPASYATTVTAACRQFLATDPAAIAVLAGTPTSGSYRVRVHDGRSVVVKLYCGAAAGKAAKEGGIIKALVGNATVRTAPLLGCGPLEAHGASALITADLGDRTLWRAVEEGERSYLEALELIGELLAAFHSIDLTIKPVDESQYQLPEAMLEARVQGLLAMLRHDSSGGLARRVEPALRQLLELSSTSRSAVGCHGDLHPANVAMCPTAGSALTPYLLDFEAAVRCVSEYDIAKSMVTSSALGDNERCALLKGYGDRVRTSDELLFAFVVFHVVDGWVYAARLEERDRSVWRSRVEMMLTQYAPLF